MDRLTLKPNDELLLNPEHWEQMLADVSLGAPEEACGLLAGQNNRILFITPVINELHSPIRFRMDPVEQLKTFQMFEERGWEMLGIYHSHPNGPAIPSLTDIAEAYYPDAIHLIWSLTADNWTCRGFRISNGKVSEVLLRIN
ncbi:MAG: M67 family metallopeptidase [Anaerolineales bacterium]|nr:M67 family metallopeptidase [Anaerolineales bacterium]